MTPNQLKQAAAQAALHHVLPHLRPDSVLGIGTGSTADFFIDGLAQHRGKFRGAVASSSASADRLRQHGIALFDLNTLDTLDFYIDGADESTPRLELIKGGGAALTQEKIIAAVATTFLCIADDRKWVEQLGRFPLPVEVIPLARNYVARELKRLGGKPEYREGVVTDNGGHILDVHDLAINNPQTLELQINQITGVITNGLFAKRPADLLFLSSGTGVKTIRRPPL